MVNPCMCLRQERDYEEWEGRLHVVGLDLRDLVALEHFTTFVAQRFGALDIIVNNACQTVRRPRAYYAPQVRGRSWGFGFRVSGLGFGVWGLGF